MKYYVFSDSCGSPVITQDTTGSYVLTPATAPTCILEQTQSFFGADFVLDTGLVAVAFGGTITLFLAGMGIGFVLSMLKKFKI